MHMSSAFGEVSDFVAIISVGGLQENEWHVEKVIGLSYTCQFRSVGYIYFAHTRAGTKSMWNHYLKTIVVPTIAASNAFHSSNEHCLRNMFSTDGEDIIIFNAYEGDIVDLFSLHSIDYCRAGANSSSRG
jgi:hypothetical protein